MEDDVLLPLLTELMDVCRVNHFPQGNYLRATLFKNSSEWPTDWANVGSNVAIAKSSRTFCLPRSKWNKAGTPPPSAPMTHVMAIHAAEQCCEELSLLVGGMIFRGRLENDQAEVYDPPAEQCCEELSLLVGGMIFRGRLENDQAEVYDSVLQKRRRERQSPGPVRDMGLVMGRDAFAGGLGGASRPTTRVV
eukprot:CAMPEP_0171326866 /NCGR_PEP_ID=MMETSP0816-20121228/117716_1 /TAXON_ID=420281 /ORGANISM="Proboscia inermis, Strain CCAP1064/1" /LENGTH=191 /DNA_ID=CAMNT_0011826433 /DNA_START=683 /DNA_END=1260 /DNA_ORIENTATION=+